MKTWDEMEPRERDAWVAENVMGWKPEPLDSHPGANVMWFVPSPEFRGDGTGTTVLSSTAMPHSTKADADYEVLKRVREAWGPKRCADFMDALVGKMWSLRRADTYRGLSYADCLFYQPGDYSHAAYLALTGATQ